MGRDFSASRAVLVGNSTFTDHRKLGDIPAAGCLAAMTQLLTSDLCGWPPERVSVIPDAAAPSDLAMKVLQAVRDVRGVLLLYYVGHGLRTYDGQLALAVRDTDADPEAVPHTALLYQNLARIMQRSSATTKLVILDCCTAELANKATAGLQSPSLADAYPVDGLYCIFAAQENMPAMFPLGANLTYFTETFTDTIRDGIPGQAADLRLDQIYTEVRRRLALDGLPQPADSGIRDARQYPFARNAAHHPPTQQPPADPARTQRLRLLREAENAAAAIVPGYAGASEGWYAQRRALALLHIAAAVRADDPGHAARLATRAARLTAGKVPQLIDADQVTAMAAVDPHRAERMAREITDSRQRAKALATVAVAAAVAEPEYAETITTAVLGLVPELAQDHGLQYLVEGTAAVMAAADPDRALSIAHSIGEPSIRASALAQVAERVAVASPELAEQIASTITNLDPSCTTQLRAIVRAMAEADPGRAERIACMITAQDSRDETLGELAETVAVSDHDSAARIIGMITDPAEQGSAWSSIVWDVAGQDPDLALQVADAITDTRERAVALDFAIIRIAERDRDRARQLITDAEDAARSIPDYRERERALERLASGAARADAATGQRIASGLADPAQRDSALSTVAQIAALSDLSQAEQIAETIAQPYTRLKTITGIARIVTATGGSSYDARRLLTEAAQATGLVADPGQRTQLLADIAAELAAYDHPGASRLIDEAEVIARTIPGERDLVYGAPNQRALVEIVRIIAERTETRPHGNLDDHGERIARAITDDKKQSKALSIVAKAVFTDDPGRAERAALAIVSPEQRVETLIEIAAMHAKQRP